MSTTEQTRSIWRFVGVVVAIVALATYLFGWALPLVIFLVLFIVMAHEFGHYITAKWSGMKVSDFFVGFGPVLWSVTRGDTRYGVRAIWAGGYVKVPGMSWSETVEPDEERRTYRSASYPRKVLFASAGSIMHMIMALAIAIGSLIFIGLPSSHNVAISGFAHFDHGVANAAQVAGLRAGDRVIAVDSTAHPTLSQLVADVQSSYNKTVTIVVERQGHDLTLYAHPLNGQLLSVGGAPVTTAKQPVGYLGIELSELNQKTSFFAAVPQATAQVWSLLTTAVASIGHVFSPHEFVTLYRQVTTPKLAVEPSQQAQRPVSIVGVVRVATQAAQSNTAAFLKILVILNIFIGVLNMLPLLPLDGGHVAVATYERLRRRRGQLYHADVNKLTPIVYAFVLVLLFLFASSLFLDIAHPIANPFK